MTPRQQRFCYEYVLDLNATKAAMRAGYSERTANKIASQLMKKQEIKATIDELKKNNLEELQITRERVLQEIAAIAFMPIGKVKANDKLKALFMLNEYLTNPYKEVNTINDFDDKVIIIDDIKNIDIKTKSDTFNVDI